MKHWMPWVLLAAAALSSLARGEDAGLARLFDQHGIEGTLVIVSVRTGRTVIHDEVRAARSFSPASTFKVFNTLIALEEGAVVGGQSLLNWDGRRHDFPDWNRDQTLESAFKVSCVWCFQALASRVGAQKYRTYLRDAAYGTLREPFDATMFWLDGSLQVSAIEQIEFLRKLHSRQLPFSAGTYETLRALMLVQSGPDFAVRAKTGWSARTRPEIGWYIGYVEAADDVWLFALNITVRNAADLPLRQKLTLQALRAQGILR